MSAQGEDTCQRCFNVHQALRHATSLSGSASDRLCMGHMERANLRRPGMSTHRETRVVAARAARLAYTLHFATAVDCLLHLDAVIPAEASPPSAQA